MRGRLPSKAVAPERIVILSKTVSRKLPSVKDWPLIKGSFRDTVSVMIKADKKQEASKMKGFYTGSGYCGYVDGRYVLFSSESDYYDSVELEDDAA